MGGDVEIVHTDRQTLTHQASPDLTVVKGCLGAIGQHIQATAEVLHRSKVPFRVCTFLYTMQ
jgi:hypothetical protein